MVFLFSLCLLLWYFSCQSFIYRGKNKSCENFLWRYWRRWREEIWKKNYVNFQLENWTVKSLRLLIFSLKYSIYFNIIENNKFDWIFHLLITDPEIIAPRTLTINYCCNQKISHRSSIPMWTRKREKSMKNNFIYVKIRENSETHSAKKGKRSN